MAQLPTPSGPGEGAPGSGLGRYTALVAGAGVTVVAMVVVGLLGGGSGSGHAAAPAVAIAATGSAPGSTPRTTPTPATTRAPRAATADGTAAPTTAPAAPSTTDPGALPQTDTKPDAASATFTSGVNALWSAIAAGDPARAMPFFFPLTAYEQVKAISNPDADWSNRLVAAYREDIQAWHAQLGANAANAKLVSVAVPDTAQWIQPGAESNKGSYWRVYNTVLTYQVDGRTGTFTVASMISWRGEWYVVHLASIR